jgi:hypothetical protein
MPFSFDDIIRPDEVNRPADPAQNAEQKFLSADENKALRGADDPEAVFLDELSESEVSVREVDAVEKCATQYVEELRDVAVGPIQEPQDYGSWGPRESEHVALQRQEFNANKQELIETWQQDSGQNWPRYEKDVSDPNTGTPIRLKGDLYDAHHVQPLKYGGENSATNIVPVHAHDHYDHRGIHRPDSGLSQLEEALSGETG